MSECAYCGNTVEEDHDLINKDVHTDCQDVPNDTPACSHKCARQLLMQYFNGRL